MIIVNGLAYDHYPDDREQIIRLVDELKTWKWQYRLLLKQLNKEGAA